VRRSELEVGGRKSGTLKGLSELGVGDHLIVDDAVRFRGHETHTTYNLHKTFNHLHLHLY
jgi:hypothetical protein